MYRGREAAAEAASPIHFRTSAHYHNAVIQPELGLEPESRYYSAAQPPRLEPGTHNFLPDTNANP